MPTGSSTTSKALFLNSLLLTLFLCVSAHAQDAGLDADTDLDADVVEFVFDPTLEWFNLYKAGPPCPEDGGMPDSGPVECLPFVEPDKPEKKSKLHGDKKAEKKVEMRIEKQVDKLQGGLDDVMDLIEDQKRIRNVK